MAQPKFLVLLKDLADYVLLQHHKWRSQNKVKGELILDISDFSDNTDKIIYIS